MVLRLWKVSCEEQALGGYKQISDAGSAPLVLRLSSLSRGWHRDYSREEPRCDTGRALAGKPGCIGNRIRSKQLPSTPELVIVGNGRH